MSLYLAHGSPLRMAISAMTVTVVLWTSIVPLWGPVAKVSDFKSARYSYDWTFEWTRGSGTNLPTRNI